MVNYTSSFPIGKLWEPRLCDLGILNRCLEVQNNSLITMDTSTVFDVLFCLAYCLL